MKVALVSGIIVEHDAISGSVEWHARLLSRSPVVDEVVAFAHHINRPLDIPGVTVADAWQLLAHPEFRSADVAVFHFGIRYGLFDAMALLPSAGLPAPVVQFHNVTPASLVPISELSTIAHSMRQAELIGNAKRVWADSEFNRSDLAAMDIAGGHVVVLPIPVEAPRSFEIRRDDTLRFAYVGRIVESKGISTLMDAFDRLPAEIRARSELVLAGNAQLSDGGYFRAIADRCAARPQGDGRIVLRQGLSDDDVWELYHRTDVFVTASLHEGLCLPVIEAASSGCEIVATACGNLPNLVWPEHLVPAGHSAELSRAMQVALSAARSGKTRELPCVADHRPERVAEQLDRELEALIAT